MAAQIELSCDGCMGTGITPARCGECDAWFDERLDWLENEPTLPCGHATLNLKPQTMCPVCDGTGARI